MYTKLGWGPAGRISRKNLNLRHSRLRPICGPSNKRRESRQRCPRSCHIVDDNLAAIQAHHSAALRLRIRVAGIVAHRFLPFPRLAQRIVDVRIVVDKRVRIGAHRFVFALGVLLDGGMEWSGKLDIELHTRESLQSPEQMPQNAPPTCESLELTSDGFSVTLLSSGFSS